MKILAISDTHGKTRKSIEIIDSQKESLDMVVHLGDYISDAQEISANFKLPFEFVGGNMDGTAGDEAYKTIETPYGKILLTHGHLDSVKSNLNSISYRTEEMGCKAVIFGHTHSTCFAQVGGIYLINPGSISAPRLTTQGTYFILDINEKEILCTQYFVDKEVPQTQNVSGKLKDILNNSDRF